MVGSLTQNTSDERLKDNFRAIPKPIKALRALSGWLYDWKVDLCREVGYIPEPSLEIDDIGLKAQAVKKYFPQAVAPAPFDMVINPGETERKSKSGEHYLTVKYEKLVPVLFAIGNVQQDLIEKLTRRDRLHETRIKRLEKMVSELFDSNSQRSKKSNDHG
jgi:hypothetical protein